ncbi:MAG: hypothetical protein P1V20_07035 [Verrucomicrobiales bacterium]|nr:hypothetical protein [Verrucomicrobiales bacterium]
MKFKTVLFVFLLTLTGCDFRVGQSSAHEVLVHDGDIVLLKNGKHSGAFILKNQSFSPKENTDYQWFYRADGVGTFPVSDPAVSTGIVTDATGVKFGSFDLEWSGGSPGEGWVYYSITAGSSKKTKAKFQMCITTETDITVIDANDSMWHFRERPDFKAKNYFKTKFFGY